MATQIDARVKQKTGTEADFAGYNLLEGEIALVRTSVNGPVFNFKVGPGNFDELDWSLQTPGAPIAADTSTSFPSDLPGLYVPTENGTYGGSVTVDMEDGYQVLVWDGSTLTKVVFPIDLSGYAKESDLLTASSVLVPDNIYDEYLSVRNRRFMTSDGSYTTGSGFLAYRMKVTPSSAYIVTGNGSALSYCRYDASGDFIDSQVPSSEADGSFVITANQNTHYFGINLLNDGDFNRTIQIVERRVGQTGIVDGFKLTRDDDRYDVGNNLINKKKIVFGGQVTTTGFQPSGQMCVKIDPVPPAGVYCVSGVANFSAFRSSSNSISQITTTNQGGYWTFTLPSNTDALYLNLAANEAGWVYAETAMMNSGSTPLPYEPYYSRPKFGDMVSISVDDLDYSPATTRKVFIRELNAEMIFSGGYWRPSGGGTPIVGKVFSWDFSGGSLAADGVLKSSNFVTNSETYSTGVSYAVDAGIGDTLYDYLYFDSFGDHLFEFQTEVMEFTVDRMGGLVGILYKGTTGSRKVNAHALIYNNGLSMRDSELETPTAYNFLQNISGIPPQVGNKYRIVHSFHGSGRTMAVYDITNDEVLLGRVSLEWPTSGAGGYSHRPNNRKFGIMIRDAAVTITKYEIYQNEPSRANLVIMGDSISVARVASAYDKGWSKLATNYIGYGAIVHGGGSNTAEDLLNSLQDTLDMKPNKVVLAIGTNDCVLNKPNRYAEHQSIVSQLEAIGAEVIISNVIPAYSQATDPDNWTRITDYNAWLQTTYGADHIIVDQFSALVNGSGDDWNPLYKADDLHPNDLGHQVMFETLKPYL